MLESLLSSAVVASLISIAFGWTGRRYLERKLEEERAAHAKELARVTASEERELERHRSRLRLSETYFNSQLEACTAVFGLVQDWVPSPRRPDMDWGDALMEMAGEVEGVEKRVTELIQKYFAVLPPDVMKRLTTANALASEAKFYVGGEMGSGEGLKMVEEAYDELRSASATLKEALDGQRHDLAASPIEVRSRSNSTVSQ